MTLPMSHLPSLKELTEFRNAIAITRAVHSGNMHEAELVAQLIDDPELHVTALRSLVHVLLVELDTAKRDSDEVLRVLVESAAMQETRG